MEQNPSIPATPGELWALGAVVALLYVALTLFGRWCQHSPAVPMKLLDQLRVGMSAEEVQRLLGVPLRRKNDRGVVEWRFGHRLKRHSLTIRFGRDQRVVYFSHQLGSEPSHSA